MGSVGFGNFGNSDCIAWRRIHILDTIDSESTEDSSNALACKQGKYCKGWDGQQKGLARHDEIKMLLSTNAKINEMMGVVVVSRIVVMHFASCAR